MELGSHIKRHRAERGLSQEALAEAIYVSRQTVSNWETGKTYPDVHSLLLLSHLFDVSVDDLIKGDVETMKATTERAWRRMSRLVGGGYVLFAAGLVLLVLGLLVWGWPLAPCLIIFGLLFGAGMACLHVVERMKKTYDLVTCQEILAFSKGEPVDRANEHSQQARRHRRARLALLAIVGAAGGAAGGACFGYALAWLVDTLAG